MEFGISKKQRKKSLKTVKGRSGILFLTMMIIAFLFAVGCATEEPRIEGNVLTGSSTSDAQEAESVKTFVMTGENFKFVMDGQDNPDLKVKVGDTVRIEFTTTKGFHDWVVDEFNARTEKVKDGQSTVVEFVVDKAGTFEYYCSIGTHRQNGMKGNLIVE